MPNDNTKTGIVLNPDGLGTVLMDKRQIKISSKSSQQIGGRHSDGNNPSLPPPVENPSGTTPGVTRENSSLPDRPDLKDNEEVEKYDPKYNNDQVFYYDRLLSNPNFTARIYRADEKGNPDGSPLARGIINNNYGYSVSNNWGTQAGWVDNAIESIGKMATGRSANLFGGVAESLGTFFSSDFLKSLGSTLQKVSNMNIFSTGKLIKFYGGTEIDFKGEDSLEILLITDDTSKDESSIYNTLKNLNDVSIGKLMTKGEMDSMVGFDTGGVSNYVAFQQAPNGYNPDIMSWFKNGLSWKSSITGSLILQVGNLFTFSNLVIKNLDVQFDSRRALKVDDSGKITASKTPLYAKVTVSFEYARVLTSPDVENIFMSQLNS